MKIEILGKRIFFLEKNLSSYQHDDWFSNMLWLAIAPYFSFTISFKSSAFIKII